MIIEHLNQEMKLRISFYNGPHEKNIRIKIVDTAPPFWSKTIIVPHDVLVAVGKEAEKQAERNNANG